ncbi:MAG TPA: hypothetical protein VIY90_12885 [Steroidobacteraceae bacterium]
MKPRTARLGDIRAAGVRSASRPGAPPVKSPPQMLESAFHRHAGKDDGILVQEDELGSVTAQHLYKMRCECGRSWFELELPKLVKCPACQRINLVSV